MSDLLIASSEADARAADAVREHHAAMAGELALLVERLVGAATSGHEAAGEEVRRELLGWCARDLLPHARAEEQAMYPAAGDTVEGRLLIEAMLGEHELVVRLIDQVAEADDLVRAAAAATALRTVFESHLAKENDLILPVLATAPGVSVAELLSGMHELLGGHDAAPTGSGSEAEGGCGGHACTCGEVDGPDHPELDARAIPHAIRHATIFGALESLEPGSGLVLLAPHDPLPLLAQIDQRWPGRFTTDYRERGPETWKLALVRGDA
ncbi:DUF2249 domain-containing protein [Nocardioides pelophilus]|uniref:DUF2249 domain-containing protein n=1 Tax=Nocardioides pelophilus TaxID=2172019 RepID=UPI001600A1A5|nr:DUF2249 domain-containing protein [Nocardioides pelophilus]